MNKREAKIYWFKKTPPEKGLLIFDAGYNYGDIHIYEHKETLKSTHLDELLKKHGYCMKWDLLQQGQA